jgi:uncharacterized Zn finger protein (UPF0148 family)
MANAKPSLKIDPKYTADQGNEHKDKSPIRMNAGTKIMKTACPVCQTRYGYNVLDGDPGCLQCEANITVKKLARERLEKLEAEAIQAEKDAIEYAEKEAGFKKRIADAKSGKLTESKSGANSKSK